LSSVEFVPPPLISPVSAEARPEFGRDTPAPGANSTGNAPRAALIIPTEGGVTDGGFVLTAAAGMPAIPVEFEIASKSDTTNA
jgi:hypothetical protein